MMSVALGVASLLVLLILSAGASCWTIALLKLVAASRRVPETLSQAAAQLLSALGYHPEAPLIPWSPRRSVPWGLVDVSAVFVVFAIPLIIVALASLNVIPAVEANRAQTLSEKQVLVWFDSFTKLGLLAVAGPLIAWRTGANWRDFGFSARELWPNVKLGLVGFVMLAPPVYAIQGVLVYFWKPSKHPLMEMFKESPDAAFFAALFVAAAVVAPLFEELVFRVLLQGFLEKVFSFAGPVHELVFGSPRIGTGVLDTESIRLAQSSGDAAPEIDYSPARQWPDPNPVAPPVVAAEPGVTTTLPGEAEQGELRGLSAWLPIVLSSLIFALMHYSHGPDWVPLIVLASGMGYLYQRTHRVVPSLVVHALLNSLSMFGLWLQIFALPEQGIAP